MKRARGMLLPQEPLLVPRRPPIPAILRRLGSGGFGTVYEAFDGKRGALVALKLLRRPDARAIYLFKQELRALAGIVHPRLVRLYELHRDDARWSFTLELVSGTDVITHVRGEEGPDEARLRAAFREIAEGLSFLHEAGKLHRDIIASYRVEEAATSPVLRALLAALREGLAADVRVHEIDVGELPPADAVALAGALLAGAGASGGAAARIAAEAHRSPLFITELARLAGESGPPGGAAPTLSALLAGRIRRLPAPPRPPPALPRGPRPRADRALRGRRGPGPALRPGRDAASHRLRRGRDPGGAGRAPLPARPRVARGRSARRRPGDRLARPRPRRRARARRLGGRVDGCPRRAAPRALRRHADRLHAAACGGSVVATLRAALLRPEPRHAWPPAAASP